jgi:hypothetical protein
VVVTGVRIPNDPPPEPNFGDNIGAIIPTPLPVIDGAAGVVGIIKPMPKPAPKPKPKPKPKPQFKVCPGGPAIVAAKRTAVVGTAVTILGGGFIILAGGIEVGGGGPLDVPVSAGALALGATGRTMMRTGSVAAVGAEGFLYENGEGRALGNELIETMVGGMAAIETDGLYPFAGQAMDPGLNLLEDALGVPSDTCP